MKKIIGVIVVAFTLAVGVNQAQCCAHKKACASGEITSCPETKGDKAVKAYYFHATRRCATCQAVESVSKAAIQKNYNGKVNFVSINREEAKNAELVKKYKISGQTLLIIKGDDVVNLTNYAFMNARNNPDKLKAKIKETIDAKL